MSTPDQPQDLSTTTPTSSNSSWKVDFKWGKRQLLITSTTDDSVVAIIHYNLRDPHLDFRTPDDKTTFGTGHIRSVSIHPYYECQGFKGELRASSRWYTRYQHLSPVFGTPQDPMVMSWSTSSSFKDWDFICSDDQGEAVARFSTRIWATKRVGVIEFVGPRADDLAARQEILVTGTLLHHTMLTRVNNPLNLLYSIFGKAGPIEKQGSGGAEADGVADGKQGEVMVSSQQADQKLI